jgi:hypothetical protein
LHEQGLKHVLVSKSDPRPDEESSSPLSESDMTITPSSVESAVVVVVVVVVVWSGAGDKDRSGSK